MPFSKQSQTLIVLAGLFIGSIALRCPFASHCPFTIDAFSFCHGAIYSGSAHPPGYIGYCWLGHLVNLAIHDINTSFIVINVVLISTAVASLYLLGKRQVGDSAALIASILFTTSLSALYFSELCVSYVAEGSFAIFFGLASWQAMKTKRLPWVICSTLIYSAAGAIRQTSLVFLFPLWLWSIVAGTTRSSQRLVALVTAGVSVALWQIPNAQNIDRMYPGSKNFAQTFYNQQIAISSNYDRSALLSSAGIAKDSVPGESERHFVWPAVEVAVALWNHISPPNESSPDEVRTASLLYGFKLASKQLVKLTFFLCVTGGPALLFLLCQLVMRKTPALPSAKVIAFWAAWCLPALTFFIFGHFGSWGYLLIISGPLYLMLAKALVSTMGDVTFSQRKRLFCSVVCAISLSVIPVAFFAFAKPLPETAFANRLANTLLLDYTFSAMTKESEVPAYKSAYETLYRNRW